MASLLVSPTKPLGMVREAAVKALDTVNEIVMPVRSEVREKPVTVMSPVVLILL